jgi:hypothetical protein
MQGKREYLNQRNGTMRLADAKAQPFSASLGKVPQLSTTCLSGSIFVWGQKARRLTAPKYGFRYAPGKGISDVRAAMSELCQRTKPLAR